MTGVTVAFYKAQDRWFDKAVRFVTGSKYSHCECIVNGISYSSSYRDGGVRQKVITYKPGKWDFIHLPEASPVQVVQFFHDYEETPYDVLGLFGFIVPAHIESRNKLFCSEACAAALGFHKPYQFSPGKLYERLSNPRS